MKTKNENTELPILLVRLQQFIDVMHLSVYQVNKEAGLCKGLLLNAFNRKQGLTTSTLEAILMAYPQLNANWLIVGRGEMFNETKTEQPAQPSSLEQHIQHLDKLQSQCVELIKTIQQMKKEEQDSADANLLKSLGVNI